MFEELTDVDVLQPKTSEGSQNSGSAEETINTEVNGSSEGDKDSKTKNPISIKK